MRINRIVAVAQRDLAQELKGRRGWVLPAIMAGLLLPVSGAPLPSLNPGVQTNRFMVSGDVPPEIAALDSVTETPSDGRLQFRREGEGPIVVSGTTIPPEIRQVLDAGTPTVTVHAVTRTVRVPNRSLLFALISASTLTGAISASIAGERTHRTLGTLLTAAITRYELILGKALAWGGLGAVSSLVAAAVPIALGRVDAGWWLLPLPTVPIATVAIGLFMVRRASDLIGGTTVTLRVLPAILAGSGITATFVGMNEPLAGAVVPLGGALMTAGSTWGGHAGPAILSTVSTLALTAVCLVYTARDLEESPGRSGRQPWAAASAGVLLTALSLWWVPFLVPNLWAAAGNATLADQLPIRASVVAGIAGFGLMSVVHAARSGDAAKALSVYRPPSGSWRWALVVGLALVWASSASGLIPLPDSPPLARARLRMADGQLPLWAGPGWMLASVVANELLFRGWLQRIGGPIVSVVAWTVVKAPLDPIHGLLTGGLLSTLTVHSGGSVLPAVLAHATWALLTLVAPEIPSAIAISLAVLTFGGLSLLARRTHPRVGSG